MRTLLAVLVATLPAAPKRPVTDTYHGVAVVDDYRWLENLADPEVRRWAEAEGAFARAQLDAMPDGRAVRARTTELLTAPDVSYKELRVRAKLLFAEKNQPPKDEPALVVMAAPEQPKTERTLLDPTVLDPSGHTAMDWYVPSLDGKRLAVALSKNGTESADVHVYDVATGHELGDLVPRVNFPTGGGSLAWTGDGSGFYYTRYPHEGERPAADMDFYQQIWFHKLGTPEAKDLYVLGKDFPRIAEVKLETALDGKHILASVANGDGGEFAFYVADAAGRWTPISGFKDGVKIMHFGIDDAVYAYTVRDAPRGKILRMPLATPGLAYAKQAVPQGEAAIVDFTPAASRLYVTVIAGGPMQLLVYDLGGKQLASVPVPPVSAVDDVELWGGDDILVQTQGYLAPPSWSRYAGGTLTPTALALRAPVDLAGYEARVETALSRDGTKVPFEIVARKGLPLDGNNPTLLNAYGGYGVSQTPEYHKHLPLWLENGGVYVEAHIRGGGEWGEAWHLGGNLVNKQKDYDDFAAVAQRLVELKITSPKRLGIEGGSNGGLLMGAVTTQHPELYGAVVSYVGIYDMLRVETTANGAFNITEYGTVKDPEQFKALYGYSPYHHVTDGKVYPPMLLFTGINDRRVEPWHSFKMTARLQAASPKNVALLRVNPRGGHGIGGSVGDKIDTTSDEFTFLFHELGVKVARGR